MSVESLDPLPNPQPTCRVTVVIPARDEARTIGATLHALIASRDITGGPLAPGLFDILVYANNCCDNTADIVRRIAARTPAIPIFVIDDTLDAERAHVGTARKHIMDVTAARFLGAGRPNGIIASLDSDTLPGVDWIAWILREMDGRDAVAGQVTLAEPDRDRLIAPVRLLYTRELVYRAIVARAQAHLDPRPEDPYPRHGSFVGASFAVSVRCYIAAGGLPPLDRLEDLAFARALHRIDARVRHSPNVRATTSARLAPRVNGGFGTFLADLHDCARRGASFRVEHPQRTLEDLTSRAALRRIWAGVPGPGDVAHVADVFSLAPQRWLPSVERTLPLGAVYEQLAARATGSRRPYDPVPVELATATLRAAVARDSPTATLRQARDRG